MENAIAFIHAICQPCARLRRVLSILKSELGGAAEPREGRAKVVSQIVERLTQNADVRRVPVEKRIQLANKDGQLAAAMGRPGRARRSRRFRESGAPCRRLPATGALRATRAWCRRPRKTRTRRRLRCQRRGAAARAKLRGCPHYGPTWIKRPSKSVREAIA